MKTTRIVSLLLVTAMVGPGCADEVMKKSSTPPQLRVPISQLAEQRIRDFNRAQLEQTKYYETLMAAVRQEPRNETWAREMEAKLHKTYAESVRSLPGALKGVSCKSSKCELELETGYAQPPEAFLEHRQAIDQWIAWSQPCAFTIAERGALQSQSESTWIFIDCMK